VSLHPKEEYRRAAAGKSGLGNPDERNRIRLAYQASRGLSADASAGLGYLYTPACVTRPLRIDVR